MNRTRLIKYGILILVIVAAAGSLYVVTMTMMRPEAEADCTPKEQHNLVTGFKGDVIIIGLIVGIGVALMYYLLLRYQFLFPHADFFRIAFATAIGVVFAALLTFIDYHYWPNCLEKAMGSNSSIWEEVAKIRSLAGIFVGNAKLAIILDQLIIIILSILSMRFGRWLYLRKGVERGNS